MADKTDEKLQQEDLVKKGFQLLEKHRVQPIDS